jgi:hypothetical protein
MRGERADLGKLMGRRAISRLAGGKGGFENPDKVDDREKDSFVAFFARRRTPVRCHSRVAKSSCGDKCAAPDATVN